jgi:chromosome segregation ATPase
VHDQVESSLFNLLIETSPYDPRLQEEQEDVQEIADLGQVYIQQHSQLQVQVAYLTTVVNEILREDITELEANLDLLKTTSTPVFIQALASEELMNRTITEFQMAQDEITRLVEFYITNITQSLSAINDSHSLAMEALESLTSQLQLLNTRASEISLLVSELISVTNALVATVHDIQTLNVEIQSVASILQHNMTYVQHHVNSLTQLVRRISIDIMELTVSIGEQMDTIPDIPSPSYIEELQASLSSSQSTVEPINNRLGMKVADISHLHDAVSEKEREVDSLTELLQEFGNQAQDLEDHVKIADNMTMTTVTDVERKMYEAEIVLENLQHFSIDTFEVARRANEALSSAEGLTSEADIVLESVAAIEKNVSELRLTLHDAIHNTYDADNITRDTAAVTASLDADTVLSTVYRNQNTSQESLDEALELQMQAQHYQERLFSLKTDADRDEEAVQNSSQLIADLEELLQEANSSVRTLEAALTSLDYVESSQLQQVVDELNRQLSLLQSELSSADIQMLYASLSQSLEEQKSIRQELENSLATMEAEIQDLQHLESMLPLGCDRNL